MRLSINFLDNPLDQPDLLRIGYPYEVLKDRQYSGEIVVLENRQFAGCAFRNCTLLYSGGPFAMVDCEIDFQTIVRLTGPAARGRALLEKFRMGQPQSPTEMGDD